MKKLVALAAIAAIGAVAIGGCGKSDASDSAGNANPETMQGSWVLESGKGPHGPVDPVEGSPVEFVVDDQGQASGTAGCNGFGGPIKVEEGRLEIGPLASTLMACDEALMQAESAYLAALEDVSSGEVSGDKMTLTGTDTELKFNRAE